MTLADLLVLALRVLPEMLREWLQVKRDYPGENSGEEVRCVGTKEAELWEEKTTDVEAVSSRRGKEGHMKKLGSIVMMLAIASFVTATIAFAQNVPPGSVHGTYELFATGTCLHSAAAFTLTPSTIPDDPATAYDVNTKLGTAVGANTWVSSYMGRGAFTFHGDGTGTMRVTQSCILPVGELSGMLDQKLTPPIAFSYWLAEGGIITVHIPIAPIKLWLTGTLSPDHKTMTLASTMQEQSVGTEGAPHFQVCTIHRILFRAGE